MPVYRTCIRNVNISREHAWRLSVSSTPGALKILTMVAFPRSPPLHYFTLAIISLSTLIYLYTVRDRLDFDWSSLNLNESNQVEELPQFTSTNPTQNVTRPEEPKIHLVVAAMKEDDYTWTSKLNISGMAVIPYIADNPKAQHHPPKNKGHEAVMYLQYMYEFYDALPEISVFSHAGETSWHIEGLLHNMTFILQNLDFDEVKRRDYLNLRVYWANFCPNWLHTSAKVYDSVKPEQRFMENAFKEIFPDVPVPETWSAPCCSQFAVTSKAIRSVPRQRYADWIQWLLDTRIDDANSGRLWEHFWSYIFLNKPIECPVEWKTYCQNYGICFDSKASLDEWEALDTRVSRLRDAMARYRNGNGQSTAAIQFRKQLDDFEGQLNVMMETALERGRTPGIRSYFDDELYEQ